MNQRSGVAMQGDVIVDKENVEPRGSAVWSQHAMLAKNKGLGGGGHDAVRKERSGILASNSTANNGGGAAGLGSLELLKERVKQLTLSNTNGASGDSGSRVPKQRTPVVDTRSCEGALSSSLRSFSSKDGTGHSAAQERFTSQSQELSSFSKLSHSRANALEQSERNPKNNLHSSGGHIGSKTHWSGSLKVLEPYQEDTAKSRDRGEGSRSRVEAWVNAFGQAPGYTGSTPPVGSHGEQHVKANRRLVTEHRVESKSHHLQSLSTSRDGASSSSTSRQGTPYKRRLPILEQIKAGIFTQEDEAQSSQLERHGAGCVSSAAVSSRSAHDKEIECFEARDKVNKVGVRTSYEGSLKIHDSHLNDKVSGKRASELSSSSLLTSAEISNSSVAGIGGERLSGKKLTFSESTRLTGSSGMWGHPEPARPSEEDEHQKEASKWGSSHVNTDTTAVASGSSFLVSKMTGASSSGSSTTPGLSGGSPKDEDTVGFPESLKQQTPLSKENILPSSHERMSSRTRISKRLKALGPGSRLLMSGPAVRVAVGDDSSAVKNDRSPNSVISSPGLSSSSLETGVGNCLETVSPVTPEEAQNFPDSDVLGDLKKRKAEDDPSIGDGSQVENECRTELSIQPSLLSVCDLHDGSRQVGLLQSLKATLSGENHKSLPRPGKVEEFGIRQPPLQRGAESTNGVESQLAQRNSVPDGSSEKPYGGLAPSLKCMVMPKHVQLLDRELALSKEPCDGAIRSCNSSISSVRIKQKDSPSSDAHRRSPEPKATGLASCRKATFEAKEGCEAVSMSQDGVSLRDKSDTRPGYVQDLSNSLGTLSLGERDIQVKTQSKVALQNLVDASSSSRPHAPVNQNNTKTLETVAVFPNTSHSSGRSAVTAENEPPNEQPRRLSSEMPRKELIGASHEKQSQERQAEASLKPTPSEISEDPACNAPRPGDEQRKEDGKGSIVPNQRKVLEDEKFFWVNGERYQKLGMIGKGGSSEVYKVIDSDFSIYALKKIILGGRDHSTALGYYQEIEYLERLRGKRHIVQLIDYEVSNRFVVDESYREEKIREDACMYVVLEFGEIDLAGILSKKRKEMLESSEPLDDNWIRFYWKHMLLAVKTIHEERIVHADLKPANFLLVKGELKLIDFGIAKAIQTDTTHVVRDSQVGTLNYMSPEALMNSSTDEDDRVFKCGRSSDIWSLGCILYQMVYGHTPFSHIRNMYGKIQAITSKSFKIDYPPVRDPWLVDVMKRCLTWDRFNRPNIKQLLVHPFLRPDLAPHR